MIQIALSQYIIVRIARKDERVVRAWFLLGVGQDNGVIIHSEEI
jgi:hypothetical protein